HEFAVVIGVAVIVSGFVSLTLTPMACSRFLRHSTRHNRLYTLSERFFDGMLHMYERTLRLVLRHPAFTGLAFILTLVATGYLFAVIPKGFIPTEDTGQIFAFTEAAQDISFDAMMEKQQKVAAVALKNPYVQEFFSGIGPSGSSTVGNLG